MLRSKSRTFFIFTIKDRKVMDKMLMKLLCNYILKSVNITTVRQVYLTMMTSVKYLYKQQLASIIMTHSKYIQFSRLTLHVWK